MPITDLTGYTWVGNAGYDISLSEGDYWTINFTSNGSSYISMSVNGNTERIKYDETLVWTGGSAWHNNAYRTIQITGGTDVANSDLIA